MVTTRDVVRVTYSNSGHGKLANARGLLRRNDTHDTYTLNLDALTVVTVFSLSVASVVDDTTQGTFAARTLLMDNILSSTPLIFIYTRTL